MLRIAAAASLLACATMHATDYAFTSPAHENDDTATTALKSLVRGPGARPSKQLGHDHPTSKYTGLSEEDDKLLNDIESQFTSLYDFGEYGKDAQGEGIESFVQHIKGFVDQHGFEGGLTEAKRAMETDEKRLLKLMKIYGYDIRLMEKWADDRLQTWVNDACEGSAWVPATYYPSIFIGPEWELRLVRCQYTLFPLPAEYQMDPKTGDPVYFAAVWDPILECVTPRLRYTPPRYKHAYITPPDYIFKICVFKFDWVDARPGKYGPKVYLKDHNYGIPALKKIEVVPKKYEKYPVIRVKKPIPGVQLPGYTKRAIQTAYEFPGYKNRFVYAPAYFKPYNAANKPVFPAYFYAGYSPKAKAYYANRWFAAYYKPGYKVYGTLKDKGAMYGGGWPAYKYFNDWGLDPFWRYPKASSKGLTYESEYYWGYYLGLPNQPKNNPWIAAGYYLPQKFHGIVPDAHIEFDDHNKITKVDVPTNTIDISVPGYKVAPIPYALRYSGEFSPAYYKYWRNWAIAPPDMPDSKAGWKNTVYAGKPWNKFHKKAHAHDYNPYPYDGKYGRSDYYGGKYQRVGVEEEGEWKGDGKKPWGKYRYTGSKGSGGYPSYRPEYVVGKNFPVGTKFGYKWYSAYFPAYKPYAKAPSYRQWPSQAYPGFEPAYKYYPAYAPIGFKPAYSVDPTKWSPGYKYFAWENRYMEPYDSFAKDWSSAMEGEVDYLKEKFPGMRRKKYFPGYLKKFYPGSKPYGGYFDEEGGGKFAPWSWKNDTENYQKYYNFANKYAEANSTHPMLEMDDDDFNYNDAFKYLPVYKKYFKFWPGYGWKAPILNYVKFGGSPYDKAGVYPGYYGLKNLNYDFENGVYWPGYKYYYNPPGKQIASATFPNFEDFVHDYEKHYGNGGKNLDARIWNEYTKQHYYPNAPYALKNKHLVRFPKEPKKLGWEPSDIIRAKKGEHVYQPYHYMYTSPYDEHDLKEKGIYENIAHG